MEKMPAQILAEYGTSRCFKATKRVQFDEIVRAFREFQLGCAFVPGYSDFCGPLEDALKGWREQMREKNWGR